MLILYPATLLNSFVILTFSVEFRVIYKQKQRSLLLSSLYTFSFSYLTTLAGTSGATLNESGENELPCLVSDSEKKFFVSIFIK